MHYIKNEVHTIKVFYAEYPYLSRFRTIFAVGMLPYMLPFIAYYLMEERGLRTSFLSVLAAFGWVATLMAFAIYSVNKYHVITAANHYILVRDETGTLWRINALVWDPNRISMTGIGMVSGDGITEADIYMQRHTRGRQHLLEQQARFCPPNASRFTRRSAVNSIVELTDLKVHKEMNVSWEITYLRADGRRGKLVIPKAYPNFVPSYPYTSYDETIKFVFPCRLILASTIFGSFWLVMMLFSCGLISF